MQSVMKGHSLLYLSFKQILLLIGEKLWSWCIVFITACIHSKSFNPTLTFIGKIVDAQTLSDKPQMTYAFYHQVKRGTTPKSAPTYSEKNKKADNVYEKYVCSVCGYVYDPKVGDVDSAVKPGTSFEDLSDDWVCPICGASKDQFEKQLK